MIETAEQQRLAEANAKTLPGRRWGPYLSERAWGTVREDYGADGNAWEYFPHDHARARAYRWNEDGLAGISDDEGRLCFALALWNGRDSILKERLFGLTGPEGNHGEDVKEYYYYLDSTPTHSYMKFLYKYPQRAFPYADLVETNRRRHRDEPEYELIDTGAFADDRYFDIFVEYAKAAPEDILIRINSIWRGPEPATLCRLPTWWLRNCCSWGYTHGGGHLRPVVRAGLAEAGVRQVIAEHVHLGQFNLACEGAPDLLFTDNDTNLERLYGVPNPQPYVKDAIDRAVVWGRPAAVNPPGTGPKPPAPYPL